MTKWQSMAVFPEANVSVIAAWKNGDNWCVAEAHMNEAGEWWLANSEGEYWADAMDEPTHWMPLPNPPE